MTGSRLSERRLLCEGWIEEGCNPGDGMVFVPDLAYVRQEGKIWFARGEADSLHESIGSGERVVESFDDLDLEEREISERGVIKVPKNGRWYVEGVFQRSDVENANKRVYPRSLWERLISKDDSYVQKSIKERAMIGHLEHPDDGRTDGAKGALVVTDAWLEKDGTVMGRAELLDTPNGLILQEYTRKKIRWGVSSRGNGNIKDNGQVDEDTYTLETWDAVMKPSVSGAYPKHKSQLRNAQEGADDLSEVRKKPPGFWRKAVADARDAMESLGVAAGRTKLGRLSAKALRSVEMLDDYLETDEGASDLLKIKEERDDAANLTEDSGDIDLPFNVYAIFKGGGRQISRETVSALKNKYEELLLDKYYRKWINESRAAFKKLVQRDKKLMALVKADGLQFESIQEHSESDLLSENTREHVSHVRSLIETEIDESDFDGKAKLYKQILTAMGRGSALVADGELDASQASDLHGELTKVLRALGESVLDSADRVIDQALRQMESEEDDERREGFERVVESLRERLNDALTECETLRERLEESASGAIAANAHCEALTEQLSEVEGKAIEFERRLKLAEDLLATRRSDPDGTVVAAVEQAVTEAPVLESVRDLLLESPTAQDVRDRAGRLLPRVVPRTLTEDDHASVGATTPSRALPHGLIVESEEGTTPPSAVEAKPRSRQARLAAGTVSVMERREG